MPNVPVEVQGLNHLIIGGNIGSTGTTGTRFSGLLAAKS